MPVFDGNRGASLAVGRFDMVQSIRFRSLKWLVIGCSCLAWSTSHAQSSLGPVAEISATVSSEVLQDQVQIVMSAQVQGDSAASVTQTLNQKIEQAKSKAGSPSGLRVSTGGVQTYPRYDAKGKVTGWQGRADLVLRSANIALAAATADQLTDLLAISGITFSLSDQSRRAEQSRLMDAVAHAFREKASTTARVFGYANFTIKKLNVSDSGEFASPRPLMLASAISDRAEKATLALIPDVQSVSVTVTGVIELR